MKLKDKIDKLINDDPMGPVLIPLGMLTIAMIFLFLLFGGTYLYDNWYEKTYITEISRSEPAAGEITAYKSQTETKYKSIYETQKVWTGKVWVNKDVKVGTESYEVVHHYIKFRVYDNLIGDYRESDWRQTNCKTKKGRSFLTWQCVSYYDAKKDITWTELERYVDN